MCIFLGALPDRKGFGYSRRFGIVYVDFETQERIKKDSYYKYAEIIKGR